MKPIDKYQEKFIELLKEAEEELGDNLQIRVASQLVEEDDNENIYLRTAKYKKVYRFGIQSGQFY